MPGPEGQPLTFSQHTSALPTVKHKSIQLLVIAWAPVNTHRYLPRATQGEGLHRGQTSTK